MDELDFAMEFMDAAERVIRLCKEYKRCGLERPLWLQKQLNGVIELARGGSRDRALAMLVDGLQDEARVYEGLERRR